MNARETQRLSLLEQRHRTLAARLAETGFLSSGSVVASYTTCGKPSCRCARDPAGRHGPYWQWTRAVRGRTITKRLTPSEAALYRQWIANRRAFDRIVTQMQEVSRRAGEILVREDAGGPSARRTAQKRSASAGFNPRGFSGASSYFLRKNSSSDPRPGGPRP